MIIDNKGVIHKHGGKAIYIRQFKQASFAVNHIATHLMNLGMSAEEVDSLLTHEDVCDCHHVKQD